MVVYMTAPLTPEEVAAFHEELDHIREMRVQMIAAGYGDYTMPNFPRTFRPDRSHDRYREAVANGTEVQYHGDREYDRILAEERRSTDQNSSGGGDQVDEPTPTPKPPRRKSRGLRDTIPVNRSRPKWTFD